MERPKGEFPWRRFVTIPVLVVLCLLATALTPLLLVPAWLMSKLSPHRGLWRSLLFFAWYLWCEFIGVGVAFLVWLRFVGRTKSEAYLRANFALQCRWCLALLGGTRVIFGLRFEVTGQESLAGPGALVFLRHTSYADTVLPIVFYSVPSSIRLRWVLKRELLLDPCIDVVGRRMRNCFVDRNTSNTPAEVAAVAGLAGELSEDEGIMLYPEGTRFSPTRRERVLKRMRTTASADDFARMESWTDLLPPRLGGSLALLGANPGRDLLVCAHTGFEAATRMSDLTSGRLTNSVIRLHFWRVPFDELPTEREEQRSFLYDLWDEMHVQVLRLHAISQPDTRSAA